MKEIILSCNALTPLCLGDGRKKDPLKTLEFIPGAAWRGALAWAHTMARPGKDQEFKDLFLSGKVTYSNLLPASFPGSKSELRDKADPVSPLPFTAKSCKRMRGFMYQSTRDERKHGVQDTLIPWLMFSLSGEEDAQVLVKASKCPEEDCGATLEGLHGYCRRGKSGAIGMSDLRTSIVTRTGICRRTGTIEESILFSKEVIQKGSVFWGFVLLPGDLEDKWRDFLEDDLIKGIIRVGSGRSSGLGKLGISVESSNSISANTVAEEIRHRVTVFNNLLATEANSQNIKREHTLYIPLTLKSDLILRDDCMRYVTTLDDKWFKNVTGASGKLVHQCSRTRRIGGWDGILKMPREDVWGIAAGSVFVFALEQEPDYGRLAKIQLEGIGERTSEGFGNVIWADDWHTEVNRL